LSEARGSSLPGSPALVSLRGSTVPSIGRPRAIGFTLSGNSWGTQANSASYPRTIPGASVALETARMRSGSARNLFPQIHGRAPSRPGPGPRPPCPLTADADRIRDRAVPAHTVAFTPVALFANVPQYDLSEDLPGRPIEQPILPENPGHLPVIARLSALGGRGNAGHCLPPGTTEEIPRQGFDGTTRWGLGGAQASSSQQGIALRRVVGYPR